MANNFQRGDLCGIQFIVAGANPYTLNVTSHNLDLSVLLFDITHTGLNGAGTARLAGKPDASGTVNADYDADASPFLNTPNIRPGAAGTIAFFVAGPTGAPSAQSIQVPVIVEKVHFESSVQSQVKYSFEVKQNVLAGLIGADLPSTGPLTTAFQGNPRS